MNEVILYAVWSAGKDQGSAEMTVAMSGAGVLYCLQIFYPFNSFLRTKEALLRGQTRCCMKLMKMILCWLLATVLLLSSAMAQTVECASRPLDVERLAHYPSFAQEGERWSIHSVQADALLDRFWTASGKMQMAMSVFHLALEGNVGTGVWTPVLRVYYHDENRAINARAISLLADGVRYDMAVTAKPVTRNRQTLEMITAPLTREAVQALSALTEAQSISIRLFGDFTYSTDLNAASRTEKGMVEAASLEGLAAGFALLEEAGASAYDLWDLSAKAWKSEHGFRPAFMRSEVVSVLGETKIYDAFGMVELGDGGAAARDAQNILINSGFLSGKAAANFTQNASDAAARAQRYLGLIETGCVDAQLVQALAEGRKTVASVQPELLALGETAGVTLERYWFARSVSAASNAQSQYTVHNTDNVFLAADGCIRNLSARQLHLFMQVQAQVIYNGTHAFEAELVAEVSEGTALDTLLLPLAQARLIVYAEIPAYLAADPSAKWSVVLTADGQTLEFDLQ